MMKSDGVYGPITPVNLPDGAGSLTADGFPTAKKVFRDSRSVVKDFESPGK